MKQRFIKHGLLLASATSLTLFAGCQPTSVNTPPLSTAPTASPAAGSTVLPNLEATPTPEVSPGAEASSSPAPASTPEALPAGDFGFVSKPNGFGFANGSGDKYDPANPSTAYLTLSSMQKIFGDQNVCTGTTSGANCKPTPAAKKWQDQINTGMNGGQCEGMAVLALAVYQGIEPLEALEAGKSTTFDLSYNSVVREKVGYYFAYQYTTETAQKATVKGTPNEIIEKIRPYLAKGVKDPVTLGFYGSSGGHATTPYGLADKGNGIVHLLMYDNNWPGQERYIEIDTKANTWIYNFAATNPAEKADAWQGDANSKTLEFTHLSGRLAQATCPYCTQAETAPEKNKQIWLNAGNSGNAHIKVFDKNDPSKFIGWDEKTGRWVNNLPGANLKQDKSVVKVGDVPAAPVIEVPSGKEYQIKVDGKNLSQAENVSVSVFGQGKSMKVSNIDLDPNQEDSLALPADGDSIKYKPGNSPDKETPKFSYGFDNPNGKDYEFEVDSLEADDDEELGVDLENGKIRVSDTGNDVEKYDVKVNRLNDDGSEEDFSKDEVEMGADESDDIDFEGWAGEGQSMMIGPDGNLQTEPDVEADELD
ncbi:MAG: hypothetical protein AB7I41_06130 [Candidatus Sericytochromatia bacterium]